MTIPIVATPTYELKLPSSEKVIKYRPFLVKEEKMLLLAMETKDPAQIQSTAKKVILDCTYGSVDVETCPPFDLEYIMLQLRIRSIGEKITVSMKCSKCETPTAMEIDLTKVNVTKSENHSTTIKLTDNMGVVMRYPTMTDSALQEENNKEQKQEINKSIEIIASCIEAIYHKESVYDTSKYTKQEVIDFVESLSQNMFQKIANFFQEMPSIKHDVNFACTKCGENNKYIMRGIQDFFM